MRGEDDPFEVDYADAISEATKARGFAAARMQREIDEGEDGQHEEEKCSSSDEDPEQSARTSFRHGESLALAGSGGTKVAELEGDYLECGSLGRDLEGRLADVFSIGIDIEGMFGFDAESL